MPFVRVLVVDDFEPWRDYVCSMLEKGPELQVICEVSDGLEAVQKADELKPDLILLDIGLPTLNGIEAARRIRKLARIQDTISEPRIVRRYRARSTLFGGTGLRRQSKRWKRVIACNSSRSPGQAIYQ